MNENRPTTTTKRKRRRTAWSDPTVKKLFDKQKAAAAKEAEERAEARRQQVEAEIHLLRTRASERVIVEAEVAMDRAMRALLGRLNAVKASFGRTDVTARLESASKWAGWADFNDGSMVIKYPVTEAYAWRPNTNAAATKDEVVRRAWEYAAKVRGLYYHELGHHRFTLPLATLAEQVGQGGSENWRHLHTAWNTLEDQRMERFVVDDSPVVAAYLTLLVNDVIPASESASWLLLAGRAYLPKEVRDASKAVYAAEQGADKANEVERIVETYITAPTAEVAWQAVVDLYTLTYNDPQPGRDDYHGGITYSPNPGGGNEWVPAPSNPDPADPAQDAQPQPGQGTGSTDEDSNEDDAEPQGSSDDSNEDEDSESGATSKGDDDPQEGSEDDDQGDDGESTDSASDSKAAGGSSTDEAMKKAVQDALDELSESETHKGDVRDMTAAAYSVDERDLRAYPGVDGLDAVPGERVREAEVLADNIRQAFQTATAHQDPIMQTGLRQGIIDPLRFRTRQAGDLDYRRGMDSEGNPSLRLRVNFLADISGSMGGYCDDLGVAAWAMQRACIDLGIASRVIGFDTRGFSIFDEDECPEVPVSINALGGTDPSEALRAALNHDDDVVNIVVVMTDGHWFGDTRIDNLAGPNDRVTLFLFGMGAMNIQQASNMYGTPDELVCSNDLADIPRLVERLLVDAVA